MTDNKLSQYKNEIIDSINNYGIVIDENNQPIFVNRNYANTINNIRFVIKMHYDKFFNSKLEYIELGVFKEFIKNDKLYKYVLDELNKLQFYRSTLLVPSIQVDAKLIDNILCSKYIHEIGIIKKQLEEQKQLEESTKINKETPVKKEKAPSKPKKKTISQLLKRRVWAKHIGEEIGKTKCLCCNMSDITQLTFNCGHIISESSGGETNVENLLPICQSCNSSMGTQNLYEYKKINGL
jgi:5-methylcytosine-specific restriction endonuclease McrA